MYILDPEAKNWSPPMSARMQCAPADIPAVMDNVHAALIGLDSNNEVAATLVVKPEPAVNPKKSVTPDHIICLEDGKKFKSLQRHLMNKFGLTPEHYRQRWDPDPTYPMIAPNYRVLRSDLAKQIGLGRNPKSIRA